MDDAMTTALRAGTAVKALDELTAADASHAGGKAANCARLKQAGFPVPDGLVVLSAATSADLTALVAHPWLERLPPTMTFAVRSSGIGEDSAGESFAGIHQTFLGVARADLSAAVEACRASARTPQALAYRRARNIDSHDVAIGVLVQCMVRAVVSGVVFTVNPVSGAMDEIVINASWGLGEALVSGQVDPDEFVLAKAGSELRWSRIGDKGEPGGSQTPSLALTQLHELADIAARVERHFGMAQDIEWCHDGERFWIVQSRPVTTSAAATDETEWTRANLAEVLPDLTSPQALSALEEVLNEAQRRYMGRLMAPSAQLGPIVKTFCGRLHFNLSQLRYACAVTGTAPAEALRSMGHSGIIHPGDEVRRRRGWRTVGVAPDMARIMWGHVRAASRVRRQQMATESYLRELSALDATCLADMEIWTVLERWLHEAPEHMQTVLLLANVLLIEAPVRAICARVGFPFERLVYPQLAIGERSVSAQQAVDLVALAETARREPAAIRYFADEGADIARWHQTLRGTRFLEAFTQFLAKYGHRGRYETDWALPRYKEDPTPILSALRAHVASGSGPDMAATVARQEREAAAAWQAFAACLSPWQRLTVLPRVRATIRRVKQYYLWRERVRSDMMRVLSAIREWHLVIAERFVERGWLTQRDDYFFLHLGEVGAILRGQRSPGTIAELVRDRQAERERNRALRMPLWMRESELPTLIRRAGVSERSGDERELVGQAVSIGCVEAEVVVVRDPGDFDRMKRGAILVAAATDPSWTPLFTLASGVIVEIGGVLSHASTIAREYGLPALANVKHATMRLKTGERVRLDATNGVVRRLS
jgi:rifampicin phosphotransferase